MPSARTDAPVSPVLVSTSPDGSSVVYGLTAPDGHVEEYRHELTPKKETGKERKRRWDANRQRRLRAITRLDACAHALACEQDSTRKRKRRVEQANDDGKANCSRPVELWSKAELETLKLLVLELMPEMVSREEFEEALLLDEMVAIVPDDEGQDPERPSLSGWMPDRTRRAGWQQVAEHLFAWHGTVRSERALEIQHAKISERRSVKWWMDLRYGSAEDEDEAQRRRGGRPVERQELVWRSEDYETTTLTRRTDVTCALRHMRCVTTVTNGVRCGDM